MKISYLPILALAVSVTGCGGGNDSAATPTQPSQLTTYNLDIELNGTSQAVNLTWLDQNHSVTQTTSLSRKAASYSSPTNLVFPAKHQCQSALQQQTETAYKLTINCQAEQQWSLTGSSQNLQSPVNFSWFDQSYTLVDALALTHSALAFQAPTNITLPTNQSCNANTTQISTYEYQLAINCDDAYSKIVIEKTLPFPVTLQVADKTVTYQQLGEFALEQSVSLNEMTIADVSDAQECHLTQKDNQDKFILSCQAFGLTAIESGIALIFADGSTKTIANTVGKQVKGPLINASGELLFLSTAGVEKLEIENGLVTAANTTLTGATAMTKEPSLNDPAQALTADGLFAFENGDWRKTLVLTTPALPALTYSAGVLSLTSHDEQGQFRVYKRISGQSGGSYALDASAKKSTGWGVIHADDIGLMTFWNEDGKLAYQPAMLTNPTIVNYLDFNQQVTIWRKSNSENRLIRIQDGQLQVFESYADNQFDWINKGAVASPNVVGFKDQIWNGQFESDTTFKVSAITDEVEPQLPLLQTLSGRSLPFFAQFTFSQDDTIRELMPNEDKLGWVLMWQADATDSELGTIWLSNGKTLHQVATARVKADLQQLHIRYATRYFVVVEQAQQSIPFDLH